MTKLLSPLIATCLTLFLIANPIFASGISPTLIKTDLAGNRSPFNQEALAITGTACLSGPPRYSRAAMIAVMGLFAVFPYLALPQATPKTSAAQSQSTTGGAQDSDINRLIEQYKQLSKVGKYDDALSLLQSSIYKNDPRVFNRIITIYASKGDMQKALQLLEGPEYPTKKPTDKIDAYFNLGAIATRTSYSKAREYYQKAADLGDAQARGRADELRAAINVSNHDSAYIAADILYFLAISKDGNIVARKADDYAEGTLVKKISGDRFRDGGTTFIFFDKKQIIYLSNSMPDHHTYSLDLAFSITLESPSKLTLTTPDGTFAVEKIAHDSEATIIVKTLQRNGRAIKQTPLHDRRQALVQTAA